MAAVKKESSGNRGNRLKRIERRKINGSKVFI